MPRNSLDNDSGQMNPNDPDYLPCYGNCIFSTGANEGLCSNEYRVGNLVVILPDGKVPDCPRQVNAKGEYDFIDECYADGIMYGETMEEKILLNEEINLLIQ